MRKFFGAAGSVSRITIESRALESNMLGDPSVRVVDVYAPAGHDGQGLPLLVDLVGFTGSGGADMPALCDFTCAAPSDDTALIQQIHLVAAHALCLLVERDLFGAAQGQPDMAATAGRHAP